MIEQPTRNQHLQPAPAARRRRMTKLEEEIIARVDRAGSSFWLSLSEERPTLKAIRKLVERGELIIEREGLDVAGRVNIRVTRIER